MECAPGNALRRVPEGHRIAQAEEPLDFEATVENFILDLTHRFYVQEVRYDPYQLVAVAQRLTAAGIPMMEFAQSVPGLTESSTNLYDLIKGRNIILYPDAEMRLAVQRSVALETTRGWRITKGKGLAQDRRGRRVSDGGAGRGERGGDGVVQRGLKAPARDREPTADLFR